MLLYIQGGGEGGFIVGIISDVNAYVVIGQQFNVLSLSLG